MSQMRFSITISRKSMATTPSFPNNSKSLKTPNASNRHEVLKIVADGCESISLGSLRRRDLRTWVSARPDIQSSGGDAGINNNNNGGGGGGGEGGSWGKSDDNGSNKINGGLLGAFFQGWKGRVEADPQFPFKVLIEEIVGVSAGVVGDMASTPNFGLNEPDLVFSIIVVACIVNFTLMYMLAPTGSVVQTLPGLVGTVISNGLINVRKKMDPNFETPSKAPPTWLNASTWAAHMGLSSNFRYQSLNGIEFLFAKGLPPIAFKSSVIVLRCLNNVLGGVSFVLLAIITGAQRVDEPLSLSEDDKYKLLDQVKDLQSVQSS
ncbi:hypothetical protein SUGI_1017370 [Cryptomeria japonica]|nr:hypothetical protein SUGI_1017370 [Cryptomeria japonica]